MLPTTNSLARRDVPPCRQRMPPSRSYTATALAIVLGMPFGRNMTTGSSFEFSGTSFIGFNGDCDVEARPNSPASNQWTRKKFGSPYGTYNSDSEAL